jgi:hypothetical protein
MPSVPGGPRLIKPQAGTSSAFIDLLFANSGISAF